MSDAILLVRRDGVLTVDNARPVSAEEQAALERVLDTLGVRPRQDRQQHDEPRQETC